MNPCAMLFQSGAWRTSQQLAGYRANPKSGESTVCSEVKHVRTAICMFISIVG